MPSVLLIEHSPTIRHIQRNLLIKAGYEVEIESDHKSAIPRIRSSADDGVNFDAVMLGWPADTSINPLSLCKMVQHQAYASQVIMVFAHEENSTIAEWAKARPNTAFLFWADYKRSTDQLSQLLADANKQMANQVENPASVQPIRVLFVDDSRTVRVKYKRLLNTNGYETETAGNVAEGFDKALASAYDIAIIDYFMPDATGDVLCRKLRENETTASMTSAIITGTYLDKAIKQSLEAGAVECMFKNESDDLFLSRIDAMSRHIRAHQAIEKERKRLGGILRSVGDGVYGVDPNGHISFVNPACRQILGYDSEALLIGKSAHELFHFADDLGYRVLQERCFLQKSYANGDKIQARETIFWHRSGKPIPVECTVYPLTIEDKREGSVVAFRDISEHKQLEEELRWQAGHDALTQLHNRRYFEEQLNLEVDRLKRSNEVSALLYLDLDRFKYINDTAGHAAGDRLLLEIAQQMSQRLRKSDMLARLGGDEFAVILRNITKNSVVHVAEDYREMLDHHLFVYKDKQYKINGTIGIALIDSDTVSSSEVLANADIACHIAKGEGRNRTHLFIQENDNKQAMDKDLGWSSRLHKALESDHLILHYQPIIPVEYIPASLMSDSDGPIIQQLLSVVPESAMINEALLRLDDPSWGLVLPGAFLPTAERFNMMDKIDGWVVNAALRQLAELQQQGYRGTFTINLSGQTITNMALIETIEELVISLAIDPSKMILEITETSAVSNLVSANQLITRLSALGCRFALDDFGSGFSSFSHLKNLPVDYIKIDGLFVRGVATDRGDRAIVQSINDIAHSLGKMTVAEYVEDVEILAFLHQIGVDYVQGHYLAHPMDISDMPSSNSPSQKGNPSRSQA
ncbi:MAG: EAL domain-containing protein [Candidatus Thiodiazotropha sp. 'RUGA']|nr:EAL domain-containing protein [Candidatus Thiodiazotropha sp. 'RUGA']